MSDSDPELRGDIPRAAASPIDATLQSLGAIARLRYQGLLAS